MSNELVLCDSVQAIVDYFPDTKKTVADYALDVAHIFFDSPVGSILSGVNGILQTCALMQGRRQYTKVVKYISDINQTRAKATIRMREIDFEEHKLQMQHSAFNRMMDFQETREAHLHQLQQETLTFYVDRQFQNAVDQITREFQRTRQSLENQRKQAIERVSDYTEKALAQIDKQTRDAIRIEESVCAAYRNEVALAKKKGVDRTDIAFKLTNHIIEDGAGIDLQKYEMLLTMIDNLTRYDFITFSDFLNLENKMARLR